jgi:biopolymer transport protein ExbB
MDARPLGLLHFWEAGDAVTHSIAWLLLAMSIAGWYVILSRGWSAWRIRRRARAALERFWSTRSLDEAIEGLSRDDPERVFASLAEQVRHAMDAPGDGSIGGSLDRTERITRALRQQIARTSGRLESGLTLLASIGSTAPFIGLLGTVWGIYHALIGIASSGQVMIDRVAGPVGEALVMTAAGLAVAIPAVLAYNAFGRFNRLVLADLDGFARDLLALATAAEPDGEGRGPIRHPGRAPAVPAGPAR